VNSSHRTFAVEVALIEWLEIEILQLDASALLAIVTLPVTPLRATRRFHLLGRHFNRQARQVQLDQRTITLILGEGGLRPFVLGQGGQIDAEGKRLLTL
jgi:hypothetical protein